MNPRLREYQVRLGKRPHLSVIKAIDLEPVEQRQQDRSRAKLLLTAAVCLTTSALLFAWALGFIGGGL